ncbi:MAG: Holliday junction branch migration protein RuvA [Alphaproteobacteria bacterium]
MIAKLKGLVDSVFDDNAIIDVNGVGYLVWCSSKTLTKLEVGTATTVFVETVVKEDSFTLYGFIDGQEKNAFNIITKVQGVGPKVGLAILSVLSPSDIANAIMAQDKAMIGQASGVGPKLAVRILTELKDKAQMFGFGGVEVSTFIEVSKVSDPTAMEDAVSALVNLGYAKIEAYRAVNVALKVNENANVSTLIKLALKELAG